MANVLFDIPSPPSNTVILDATRKGRVQFTVNNVSGRPLTRVAARLTALPDPTDPHGKWLKLDPDGYREFKIADSLQYSVQIAAPEDAKAGSYAFRLDIWDDTNPDDTLVKGPAISFTVPEAAPPPPKPPFPWWIPVVAVAAIVLVVGAIILLKPAPAPPPTPTFTPTPTQTAEPTSTSTPTLTPMPSPTSTPTPTPTPTSTPTPTPTPTPVPGNFSGHWNLGGAALGAGFVADLQQNGSSVVGTYMNGANPGLISGFVEGNTIAGQWRLGSASGTFIWTLTSSRQQFQGSWNDTNEWCGWRNGSSKPNPCKPLIILKLPTELKEKVIKITLVAP